MSITLENVLALEALEAKLRAMLPEQYRDSYEDVVPVSMGSAGLKYDADGRVAWDQIWGSFCDLAMAGGPPHRGTLLQPATAEAISANPEAQLRLSSYRRDPTRDFAGNPSAGSARSRRVVGRCAVSQCRDGGMARARDCDGEHSGTARRGNSVPVLRVRISVSPKKSKNVITATAKTCHYWTDHMSAEQHESIDTMLSRTAPSAQNFWNRLQPADAETDPDGYRRVVDDDDSGNHRAHRTSVLLQSICGMDRNRLSQRSSGDLVDAGNDG